MTGKPSKTSSGSLISVELRGGWSVRKIDWRHEAEYVQSNRKRPPTLA